MFKPPPTISHTPKSPTTTGTSRDAMPSPVSGSGDDAKTKATDAPAELSAVVDDLLDNLSKKFATVSAEMYEKMEAMNKRLDVMEQALNNNGSK